MVTADAKFAEMPLPEFPWDTDGLTEFTRGRILAKTAGRTTVRNQIAEQGNSRCRGVSNLCRRSKSRGADWTSDGVFWPTGNFPERLLCWTHAAFVWRQGLGHFQLNGAAVFACSVCQAELTQTERETLTVVQVVRCAIRQTVRRAFGPTPNGQVL